MMFSSVTGTSMPIPSNFDFNSNVVAVEETKKKLDTREMTTEEYVRYYFSDIPVMAEIAKCESRFRHYGSDGEVLRGEQVSKDRGVMQINEYYHLEDSQRLGFNIYTLEGNVAYARYLYEKQGTRPWRPSAKCWGNAYPNHYELAMR